MIVKASDVRIGDSVSLASASVDRGEEEWGDAFRAVSRRMK